MRSKLVLSVLSLLALLIAVAPFMSANTQAAAPARPAQQPGIVGTLVATPQATLPTTLLLQVGGQTIPVAVSANTQLLRSDSSAASLGDFHDGDTLAVYGTPTTNGGINATLIVDLGLSGTPPPTGTIQVQGTLASMPNSSTLCLQNASVTSNAIRPNVPLTSPCPSGQLPVYLTGSTNYSWSNNSAATFSALQIGDILLVTGSFINTQFTATLVQDLSQSLPQPTTTFTVQGTLASMPATGVLCLQNASVTSSAVKPNFTWTNLCPTGQLPVYLTGSTSYSWSNNSAATFSALQIGDILLVTGYFINTQFTATLVQDLSQSIPQPTTTFTVQGTLASMPATGVLCLQNASVTSSAVKPNFTWTNLCPTGQLPVYLTGSTSYSWSNNSAATFSALQIGDILLVTGYFINTQFTATLVQDLSQSIPQPTTSFTVQGTLAATPSQLNAPVTLCLANASVTNSAIKPNVTLTSPCPSGQLPVYVTSSTSFLRQDNTASGLSELSAGDTLRVTGSFVNTQFTASTVQDLSIQAYYSSLVGSVQYCNPATHPNYFTMQVRRARLHRSSLATGTVITIYVQISTQIVTDYGTTHKLSALRHGQLITVIGVFNTRTHSVSATFRIRIQ